MACILIDSVPEFVIKDGLVYIDAATGDFGTACMPLRKFRAGLARAQKLLAAHDAAGSVVQIKGKR